MTALFVALQEETGNESQLIAIEDEHDDEDDMSLPVSETTVGDLDNKDVGLQDGGGVGRFFVLRRCSLVVSVGMIFPAFLFAEVRPELLATAALATIASWYCLVVKGSETAWSAFESMLDGFLWLPTLPSGQ